ncbi:hypothetical protein CRG98_000381, partial [Punica granatum]
ISLLDRQELQQRVKLYCLNCGPPEHWLRTTPFKRMELQKALGNHLSWKDRYPPFFDDIAARLLAVFPLIIYRLIENDAIDSTERLLTIYSQFLAYHPFRYSFVRDILAYFYGHLPGKLIVRILSILDAQKVAKIPFSELFQQLISATNPICPPLDYFATLLLELIVSSLVQIIVNIQPTLIQSNNLRGAPNSIGGQGSVLPTSPSGGSTDSLSASRSSPSANTSNFVWRSGYTSEQLSCLLIQACGLLLSQLPADFHVQLYIQASQIIKDSWWLTDGKRSRGELDSAVKYALLDPSWAAQDNTSTAISMQLVFFIAVKFSRKCYYIEARGYGRLNWGTS